MATKLKHFSFLQKIFYRPSRNPILCSHNRACRVIPEFNNYNPITYLKYRTLVSYKTSENKIKSVETKGLNKNKANLLLKMNFENAEDAVPFYKLPISTLLHIYKVIENDKKCGYCKNRLYYISSHIKHPPAEVSPRLAKRTFVYSLSFDWLDSSMKTLLELGVSGERILRDLWVLKYHHNTIRERLQRVIDCDVDTLYPWMVRCSEDILNRYIKLAQETKDILGENKSTQYYLANRLSTTPEAVDQMCLKIPALKTIRVTKVKHFLDFLICEGFDLEDIAQKPRVLTASQKTVKLRLEKLRSMGIEDINLNVLCRSRKDFKKYCESVESSTKETIS